MRYILNLDTYPLDKPRSAEWQALVARCRADLAAHGMFNLPGFMHPNVAKDAAQSLTLKFQTEAFRHERAHNIYFLKSIPELPDDHPALTLCKTSNDTLCLDQITDSPMAQLYAWPEFAEFLAATMEKPALYTMADPLAGVNVMSYREGQSLNWHFDRSEFTTTLLLQAPQKGGDFIYRTDLRRDDDPNYDGVARLLTGQDPDVRSLTLTPGTLNVFRGKNTPHRVGDVKGPVSRVISVYSFFERPGVAFSEDERLGFYGRAQ
ncbi:2OG-Fe(II) oxygenase [Pararhodobacter sp.]|uniref:HalD/BesD family halogenase n=1 Tax=Pararhodobacter sp. TaxID=2127056 RepID=UPI002AFFB540|nr:2OG-Fe(II) oxygenase [Pararhodobacter sp.]